MARPDIPKIYVILIGILIVTQIATGISLYVAYASTTSAIQDEKLSRETAEEHILQTVQTRADSLEQAMLTVQAHADERLSTLETAVASTSEELSSQLAALEVRQEQTKSALESSIERLQISNKDFSATITRTLPSVVSVITDSGQGSGVIVESRGLIVTNYHVIADSSRIRVVTVDGKRWTAEPIATSAGQDLAILRIQSDATFPALAFAKEYSVGESVLALGNPGGLGFSATEGIISSFRTISGQEFIQISAPINPGNSGGPLVDVNGRVVGITTWKISGFEGIGFAIPGRVVNDVVKQVIDHLDTTATSETP